MTKAAGPRAAARALLFAGLASGCASATASPAARTCVVEAPARRTDLEVQELVTVDRGVRWLHAWKLGLGGLAWLRADGELGFVALDSVEQLHSGDFDFWRWRCTPEAEGALRCFNGPTRRDDGTWTPFWSRRVELSDTPRLGELERWEAPPGPVDRVASDGRLAVTIRRGGDQGELRLWDVAARAPTADAPVWLKGQIETLAAWCAGTCTVVARQRPADASPDRLIAVTLPGGRTRTLAPVVDQAVATRSGDAVLVGWRRQSERRIRFAALGPDGRVRGRSSWRARVVVLDDALLGLPSGRARHDDWTVLALSPRARARRRWDAETSAVGLVGVRFDGGVLLAGLSTDIHYIESGRYAFHNWRAEVEHRHLGARRSTAWRSLLGDRVDGFGEGRGGYDLVWFARPDRAAALIWGTGDARGASWLVPVRGPCR